MALSYSRRTAHTNKFISHCHQISKKGNKINRTLDGMCACVGSGTRKYLGLSGSYFRTIRQLLWDLYGLLIKYINYRSKSHRQNVVVVVATNQ